MLVTRAPGYVLEVAPQAVDLLCFEQLVAQARAIELLHEAMRLASHKLGLRTKFVARHDAH